MALSLSLEVPTNELGSLTIETKRSPVITTACTSSSDHYLLAFGDSTVSGSYGFGMKYHPFSLRLGELMRPDEWSVVAAGVNRERIKDSIKRLKLLLANDERAFEVVCIAAGLNDLGDVKSSATIMSSIRTLVELALSTCSVKRVLLCTFPSCPVDLSLPEYATQKDSVNNLIREYASETKVVELIDLATLLQCADMNEERREQLWDDHMHYSPDGSDEVAGLVHTVFTRVKDQLT